MGFIRGKESSVPFGGNEGQDEAHILIENAGGFYIGPGTKIIDGLFVRGDGKPAIWVDFNNNSDIYHEYREYAGLSNDGGSISRVLLPLRAKQAVEARMNITNRSLIYDNLAVERLSRRMEEGKGNPIHVLLAWAAMIESMKLHPNSVEIVEGERINFMNTYDREARVWGIYQEYPGQKGGQIVYEPGAQFYGVPEGENRWNYPGLDNRESGISVAAGIGRAAAIVSLDDYRRQKMAERGEPLD